jgi:molybdopterin converting factor small subunit
MEPAPVNLLAFAQAKQLLGFGERTVLPLPAETPAALLDRLFPGLRGQLTGCRVALDEAYASWDEPIGAAREMALIPPVSGG